MVYTAPATPAPGDVLAAAFWDTHVRDRILQTPEALASAAGQTIFSTGANAVAMIPWSKYKSADETVNNSTTLQNDDHLAWAVAANEVWAFRLVGFLTIASGNPDFKSAFTVPAASSGYRGLYAASANVNAFGSVSDLTTGATVGLVAATTFVAVTIEGVYIGGANAGTVQFQWAQGSAVASNMTLKLGSYLDLKRLA